MVDQLSFVSFDFVANKKRTKRDVFLGEMSAVGAVGHARKTNRAALSENWTARRTSAVSAPHHAAHLLPAAVVRSVRPRRPGGARRHPIDARIRRARTRPRRDPDETTILNFRHLLERHDLTKAIFEGVAEHLAAKRELPRGGTIVDATLIAASSSTKNEAQKRDTRRAHHRSFDACHWVGFAAAELEPIHARMIALMSDRTARTTLRRHSVTNAAVS